MTHEGEVCAGCGEPYLTVYWVPDDLWRVISPKAGLEEWRGGMLCPECADDRAREAGYLLEWSAIVMGLDEREGKG